MSEETSISHRDTFETIIASLIQMLGVSEDKSLTNEQKQLKREQISKLFSQLNESEREMLMFYIDLWNTYKWFWLKTYIFDFLNLSVSLDRGGRKEITELGKMPLQMENPTDRNRLSKFMDLFR